METKQIKLPSFGEQLLGKADLEREDLNKVRENFIEIIEILKNNYQADKNAAKSLLFDHAIGELVNAESSVFKVLTHKIEL